MSPLAILGGGSWGTALAVVLAPRFPEVRVWVHEPDLAARMATRRENDVFLPGIPLPDTVTPSSDPAQVLAGASIVLAAVPSDYLRPTITRMLPLLEPHMRFVSTTKGIESNTLLRMSEVLSEVIGKRFLVAIAVLSGPTFAREVAQGEPAALAIAGTNVALINHIQSALSGPTLRLYTNTDPIGVEVGAALKNVIAIAAGICQGLGLGSNAKAALITRGLAEITRLAVAMGGQPLTLAGLAGLGDLVLTCTGDLSRNRRVGLELAAGKSLPAIVASTRMIAEGIPTTHAALQLARKFSVSMPITEQMGAILTGSQSPREALRELMDRSLKGE